MFNSKEDKRKREILFRGQTRRLGEKVFMNGEKISSVFKDMGAKQLNIFDEPSDKS